MNKLISIIIVFGSKSKYIDKIIKSLSTQQKSFFELILVVEENLNINNYSLDIKIINQKGLPSVKRNIGSKFACGEYLIFVDDDTEIPHGWIDKINNLIKNNNCECYGGSGLTPRLSNSFQKKIDYFLTNRFLNPFYLSLNMKLMDLI